MVVDVVGLLEVGLLEGVVVGLLVVGVLESVVVGLLEVGLLEGTVGLDDGEVGLEDAGFSSGAQPAQSLKPAALAVPFSSTT